jgi:alcohol dehydrogenase class IV
MKDYTKEDIRFVMKTEMIVGQGSAKNLPKMLRDRGWPRVAIVVDSGVLKHNPYAQEIVEILTKNLDTAILVPCEMAEPTYDYLDKTKTGIEGKQIDCVVGIGGGSTMDLSKGLATLATNPGKALQYRGFGKVLNQPLPVVALPTTAGTGSEVTPYAVFIDTSERWKFGINSEFNYPRLAVYDPGFLDTCPMKIYASSGMDAMTHTLESFVAKNATTVSRAFSIKAFELLFPNLTKFAAGDRSTETKLGLLLGSGCAGIALMNAGAGPAGALSYPLGVYFDVSHGIAGSVFLPGVIQFNVAHGYTDYAQLYDRIPGAKTGLNDSQKALAFAEAIKNLSSSLGIPTELAGFGVKTEADARLIIDNAWQLKLAFEQNPIPFGKVEIENLVLSLSNSIKA